MSSPRGPTRDFSPQFSHEKDSRSGENRTGFSYIEMLKNFAFYSSKYSKVYNDNRKGPTLRERKELRGADKQIDRERYRRKSEKERSEKEIEK